MCNLWQNFVGMIMENFCGYGKIFVDMEEVLWVWNFGYGKIFLGMWCLILENFVVMILDMWEFSRLYMDMAMWEFFR